MYCGGIMIYNAIVLKKRNWLSGLFYKEIMYVDTLSLNITNKIQAAGIHFKPKTSFTNDTYCLVYCLVRSTYKNLEKFLDLLEENQDKMCLLGYPNYEADCKTLFTKLTK
jgi:hypothetical protein